MFKYGMGIIAAVAVIQGAVPAPVGQWSFDNSANLTAAQIGSALVLTGTQGAVAGPTASDGAVRIGVGSHYTVTHGSAANGGGKYVNEYTLSYDFKVPTITSWASFFQTNLTNSNDAECFVRKDAGTIGVSGTGYSSKAILPNNWYRLTVSVDNGSFYRLYLDGVKILEGTKQSVDGRFAIESSFKLFADENGEDGVIDVASVRFWNSALTDAQATDLGGFSTPSTGTILTGPYLQNVDTAGITIMWESKSSSAGTVRYGIDQTVASSATSSVYNPLTGSFVHKARLTGLTADTKYFWKVETASGSSPVKTFRTSPKSYVRPYRIGIWGDSHHASPWGGMAAYLTDSLAIDVALSTGDVSNSGNKYSDLQGVFLPYTCGTLASKVPFFVSFGNHDVGSSWGGGDLIRRFVDQPKGVNSDANGFNGSYLAMYGNTAIIAIDWNRMGTDVLPGKWLEQTLQAARVKNASLRVISIHCAPFYERWQTAENSAIKTNIPLLAEKYGVHLVFSGHMHGYERGYKNGVYYVTQGGASYMDVSEPVGPTLYNHITVGTNKPGNMPGFNNGLTNHWAKLRYFDKTPNYLGVFDSFKVNLYSAVRGADATALADGAKVSRAPLFTVNANSIRLNSIEPIEIKLFLPSGREILRTSFAGGINELSTADLSRGVYLITAKSISGSVQTIKFMK